MNSPRSTPLRKSGLGMVQNPNPIPLETHHFSRSLLWSDSDSDAADPKAAANSSTTAATTTMCPMYFNQTESLRLDNQLRGWFKLDPIIANVSSSPTLQNELKPELRKRRKPARKLARPTEVDHYVQPGPYQSGSIYHMLISDRNARSAKLR